tara:strand:- start:115 stop:687 length:573 start_codon:yes stop_codon:yes gene_type:complete
MLGAEGLKKSTQIAILNANYLKEKLQKHFTILYSGNNNRVAHEMIVDFRMFKQYGIEVVDVAKRLMDYGFHAPTVSFPVAGTLMIEPTESESKAEIDRFCEAMISIKSEIDEVVSGVIDSSESVLANAPHSMNLVVTDSWSYTYSRKKAVYPLPWIKEHKFWPTVRRVDDAYGDRNLVCSCAPIADYIEE